MVSTRLRTERGESRPSAATGGAKGRPRTRRARLEGSERRTAKAAVLWTPVLEGRPRSGTGNSKNKTTAGRGRWRPGPVRDTNREIRGFRPRREEEIHFGLRIFRFSTYRKTVKKVGKEGRPQRDLNSRPLVYKTSALTPELWSHLR